MEIGERSERSAKTNEMCKTKESAKPATSESIDKEDGDRRETIRDSVPCQNPCQRDVQTVESEEMARADKSKFQSKLMVTLRAPASRAATLRRVPPVQVPKSFNTLGYGTKQEYQGVGKRHPGFPECRYASAAACRLADGASPTVLSPVEQPGTANGSAVVAADIPVEKIQDGMGPLTEAETTPHAAAPPFKPIKIPPAPPPRTTSCLGTTIPDSPIGVTAIHHRTFRGGGVLSVKGPILQQEPIDFYPESLAHNPLMLSEPMATSSPTTSPRTLQRGHNLSLDNLSIHRKNTGMTTNDESSTEDISTRKTRTTGRSGRRGDVPHLNKSVSSPSFGTFLRRKPSEHSVSSMENGAGFSNQGIGLIERKAPRGNPQNNVSVSSSSGLDSPTKSDRRKRRVSIKFNKKTLPGEGDERGSDSRHESKSRVKLKSRHEETDVTTSERERTNSVSSRASSGVAGSGRRKLSITSNRTYVNDEKIPWCGCWGNGCV